MGGMRTVTEAVERVADAEDDSEESDDGTTFYKISGVFGPTETFGSGNTQSYPVEHFSKKYNAFVNTRGSIMKGIFSKLSKGLLS